MRIAYLECFSGISGDMFLGALIDAGVSPEVLEKAVAALNVGARLEISKVNRSGITATKVDVLVNGEKELPGESSPSHEYGHPHEHDHQHPHGHEHDHPRGNEAGEADGEGSGHSMHSSRAGAPAPHTHARGLKEIKEIILRAGISAHAQKTAIAIFEALGTAEARIHNMDIESIHFHEVGAVDAMVDIVGAAVGAEALGADEIVCSPLNVGGGSVKCAHGVFPVPAPATVELLAGAPIYSSGMQVELLTPTGAAIVKTLATRFGAFPEMRIEKSGYGAGARDFPGNPNVVRLTVGEATPSLASKTAQDTITVLEANLDDLNPQVFGYVLDRLLEEGALDVFGVPVQMKKNRPGTLLTVLCKPEDAAADANDFLGDNYPGSADAHGTAAHLGAALGFGHHFLGDVRMKIASMNGRVTNFAPEYEDCRRIAAENHVPLKTVMQEATQRYLQGREKP